MISEVSIDLKQRLHGEQSGIN